MGAKLSARAAQSVRAKLAIPMHFGTFPGLLQTADEFGANLKQLRIPFFQMKPGDTVTFRGRQINLGSL
jgi:L-ascorbate metabolism protein UlaG (beta-lactamase superfamily)